MGERLSYLVFGIAALVASDLAQATQPDGPELSGLAGVCVRWGLDSDHVEEAVVVVPTGDAALDEALPRSIQAMNWPVGADNDGAWIGIWMAVGEGAEMPPTDRFPDCSHLPSPPPRNAPHPNSA